ncbi:hypothetical protein IE81DRAFT_324352 [Ceraceosorus guamensis]|uniref:Uncharacterized protein n=1 Tax=Ceraceosorus guamensis TaxID=1522189 RepID=A0A316W1R1_9BASI|nr:hypothetical protein IE81DRAFT_324352 [Ceraceosorus guamensis]PWN41605.1 hypothetical protein IE81DRAFT_324352 [Ceraceosorus guamensis]
MGQLPFTESIYERICRPVSSSGTAHRLYLCPPHAYTFCRLPARLSQFLVSVTIAPRILRRLKLLDRSALGLEPAKAESKPIRLSRRSPSQWSDVDLNFQTSFAKPDPIQAPQQAVSPRIQSEVLVRSPSMGFRRELTENHQQTPLQTVRVELYTPPSTSDSQRGAWRRHSEDSEARLMP